jgi:hypothetical protein
MLHRNVHVLLHHIVHMLHLLQKGLVLLRAQSCSTYISEKDLVDSDLNESN